VNRIAPQMQSPGLKRLHACSPLLPVRYADHANASLTSPAASAVAGV
jgi:hypothetical protein